MPVIEAMSLGVPVVVSARGALPEVAGDAALQIDPTDDASLCDALLRVLSDDDLASTLSARGQERAATFTWEETSTRVRAAFEAAACRQREGQRD
jgi:glycosyltransferase involved in cell wall biosynthesis